MEGLLMVRQVNSERRKRCHVVGCQKTTRWFMRTPLVIVEWTCPTDERITSSSKDSFEIIFNFIECCMARRCELKDLICIGMLFK